MKSQDKLIKLCFSETSKRRLKVIGTVWQPALRKGKKIKTYS